MKSIGLGVGPFLKLKKGIGFSQIIINNELAITAPARLYRVGSYVGSNISERI